MSHTNNTTFLNLPLFIGTDKPAWLTDFNSAMQAIDTNASNQKNDIDANALAITALQTAINAMHPVGSIYLSADSTDPGTLFGGTWQRIAQGRTIIGAGSNTTNTTDTYGSVNAGEFQPAAGERGGEYGNTLKTENLPSSVWTTNADNPYIQTLFSPGNQYGMRSTSAQSQNKPHNNVQPYLAVYIWQRTA